MFLTAIQDITAVYQRGIYEILHFKTYFQHVKYSPFPLCQSPYTLAVFRRYILTYCKLIVRKRMHAACMSVFRLREREKKAWNHSLPLMMSTQRQWGAALISVTCPCASHQLHYGSISHASSANWIACEVVTMTGARAASALLLLHKGE